VRYANEDFSVIRKGFWSLIQSRKTSLAALRYGVQKDDIVLFVKANLPVSRLDAAIVDLQNDTARLFACSQETRRNCVGAELDVVPRTSCFSIASLLLKEARKSSGNWVNRMDLHDARVGDGVLPYLELELGRKFREEREGFENLWQGSFFFSHCRTRFGGSRESERIEGRIPPLRVCT
jgi:hypothetical protein